MFHGNGYATEAAGAMIAFGFETLNLPVLLPPVSLKTQPLIVSRRRLVCAVKGFLNNVPL